MTKIQKVIGKSAYEKLCEHFGGETIYIPKGATMDMQLTSPAFSDNREIPAKYTCDGLDVSPPLRWSNVPEGTKSLALICDDPDAPGGDFVHWVVGCIPANVTELPEKSPLESCWSVGNGEIQQGINDFENIGYGGSCPPAGETHHYAFKMYALDTVLRMPQPFGKDELVEAMRGHVIDESCLTGTYCRH